MKITTIANTITAKLTKFLGDATEAKPLAWIIIACIYFFRTYSARKYMITFTWQSRQRYHDNHTERNPTTRRFTLQDLSHEDSRNQTG